MRASHAALHGHVATDAVQTSALSGSPTDGPAYALVFALQALMFLLSAVLAWRIAAPAPRAATPTSNAADVMSLGTHQRQLS